MKTEEMTEEMIDKIKNLINSGEPIIINIHWREENVR